MEFMRRFVKDRSGFVTLFVLLYCLIAFAGLVSEYFRIIDLRQEAENILQRGVNEAVDDMLRDSYRRDFAARVDAIAVVQRFDNYLRNQANLDSMNRRVTRDGTEVWRVEFTNVLASPDEASLTVKGIIRTRSIISILTGDIEFPFSISSRAIRLD